MTKSGILFSERFCTLELWEICEKFPLAFNFWYSAMFFSSAKYSSTYGQIKRANCSKLARGIPQTISGTRFFLDFLGIKTSRSVGCVACVKSHSRKASAYRTIVSRVQRRKKHSNLKDFSDSIMILRIEEFLESLPEIKPLNERVVISGWPNLLKGIVGAAYRINNKVIS